jgi:quercetin dioxygenase-like cupin family protein
LTIDPGSRWRSDDAELVTLATVEGKELDRPASVRVLAESDSMLVLEVTMSGESPPHVHSHDSVGYVVSGRVRMHLGDESWELGAGDSFYHPPGVVHQMVALDDPSVWLEIKSPPVRTWLPS